MLELNSLLLPGGGSKSTGTGTVTNAEGRCTVGRSLELRFLLVSGGEGDGGQKVD